MSTSKHSVHRPPRAISRSGTQRVVAAAVAIARQCDARALFALALCAVATFGPQAFGQELPTGGEFVGQAAEALRLRETPHPPADFVRQSRPAPGSLDYQPLAPKPEKAQKKSAAELDALGADLAGARERNQRAARSIKALDAPARKLSR